MIINTGSRTDIPAFFSSWFYNRIRDGFVMVRNPFDPRRVIRYRLDPTVVDAIVFCTKNPEPMLPRIAELDAFNTFWSVTVTSYGTEIEPYVPPAERAVEALCALSEHVGFQAVRPGVYQRKIQRGLSSEGLSKDGREPEGEYRSVCSQFYRSL